MTHQSCSTDMDSEKKTNALIENLKTMGIFESIENFPIVAKKIGPEETRRELLHLLIGFYSESEGIVLKLVSLLRKMIPLVGGPDFTYLFLDLVEKLACANHTSVRQNIVRLLSRIIRAQSVEHVRQYALPVLFRLSSSVHPTARTIACGIFKLVYEKVKCTHGQNLRDIFARLCQDTESMVRIESVTKLGDMASVMSKENKIAFIMPLFVKMGGDVEPLVRRLLVSECCTLAPNMDDEEITTYILPTYEQLLMDKNWRVRLMIAETIIAFQGLVGKKLSMYHLLHDIRRLLKDTCPNVRKAATDQLGDFSKCLDPKYRTQLIRESVLPILSNLCNDPHLMVRKKIPQQLLIIGKIEPNLFMSDLLEMAMQIINDKSLYVQVEIINLTASFMSVFPRKHVLGSFIAGCEVLSDHSYWRVRMSAVRLLRNLAKEVDENEFNEFLVPLYTKLMGDIHQKVKQSSMMSFNAHGNFNQRGEPDEKEPSQISHG